MKTGPKPISADIRFIRKYKSEGDKCWIWTGQTNHWGYGVFREATSHHIQAHRYSWEFHFGFIPNDLWVLHKCDNPPCVNPEHLFLGTAKDNTQDMITKGRIRRGITHSRSFFTEEDVISIYRRALSGESPAIIAKEYECSTAAVNSIKCRRRWKHVLPPLEKEYAT